MQYYQLAHIERIKKILDIIAYGSLGLDIAVALVGLFAISSKHTPMTTMQYGLDIALIAEVFITLFLLFILFLLYHYDKIEALMFMRKRGKFKPRRIRSKSK